MKKIQNLRNLIDISAELTKNAFVDTMPVDDIIDEEEENEDEDTRME